MATNLTPNEYGGRVLELLGEASNAPESLQAKFYENSLLGEVANKITKLVTGTVKEKPILHTTPLPSGRWWVYENWTHKKAIVHRTECGFCNDGKGMGTGTPGRNGRWHGSYFTEAEAIERAFATKQPRIDICQFCG